MAKRLVTEAAVITTPGIQALMAGLVNTDPTVRAALTTMVSNLLNVGVVNDTVTTASYMVTKYGSVTLTLNRSISLVLPNPTPGAGIILTIVQDSVGTRSITWPADIEWPNYGTPPPLLTKPGQANRFGIVAVPGFSKWQGYVAT
ncbi:hypothetical protein ACFZA2_01720 [Microbacterium sp. NPDC007973]|uniref:hypothetical protein n=1 Tax=Microbacterium sp. NPDC007973 TaxID=3364182 RepID=UPI0036E253DE